MTSPATRPTPRIGTTARRLASAVALVALAASTACFSSETVIRVKADGSGTIEQVNLANKEMLGMAAGMAKNAARNAGADPATTPNLDNIGDLFDEARIREQAATWGEGVRYLSSEPITRDGLSGARAVFAFDDVRLLTTNNGREGAAGPPAPRLRFDLVRPADAGGATIVRIRLPEGRARPADAPVADAPAARPAQDVPPEALAMVRGMFKGARMSIAVEVDGAIVSTDAPRREGARATIFALDFEQLLSDPSKFAAMQRLKPGTDFAAARAALEGVPGVVFPATPTVSIEFK
jgi:hypothetical protein